MRRFGLLLSTMAICFTAVGCGYDAYMQRFRDTLAENDYREKLESALAPAVTDAVRGYSVRLPDVIDPKPLLESGKEEGEELVVETDEGMQAIIHFAVFDGGEGAQVPMRAAVFVSQPTKMYKGFLKWDALAAHILEPGLRGQWMGQGFLVSEELQPKMREVPAGPKVTSQPQKMVSIRWATLEQQTDEGQEFIWLMGIFEEPKASAIFAYRLAKEDFSKALGAPSGDGSVSTAAQVVDMSITTAQIKPVIVGAPPADAVRRGRRS